jgi:3-phenylpropionate/trans-cinnamate dioxygenase ferredoxin reductase subunit
MTARRYLIVGGGMAADAAAHAIREADPIGQVTVLSAEKHLPYSRPPLSKALWKGEPFDSIWRRTETTGAELLLGHLAVSIDRAERSVTDDLGHVHPYDALLLAMGGAPVRFPFGGDNIIYYRTLDDYIRLKALAEKGKSFAVIGGGFIGSEMAAALRMNGKEVTLLFPEDGIGARVFPRDMSEHLVRYYREKGVNVQTKTTVTDVVRAGSKFAVLVKSGERFEVDTVVAGLGLRPNTELAKAAGLAVEDGILVNEQLRTADPCIFSAGDVARFPAAGLGRSMRMEHEDAAVSMGRAAGLAMAGQTVPYTHLPSFYSDLFELGYEAVGLVDPRLQTVARWKDPFKEGTVFYLDGGKVRGVLLVNTWGQVDAARKMIEEGQTITATTARL